MIAGVLPKYVIVFDERNPRHDDLEKAFKRHTAVTFACLIGGSTMPCMVLVNPRWIEYTPSDSLSFCLIAGAIRRDDGSVVEIQGMYYVEGRSLGGFSPTK